ncbi:MAG: major facilitator superfamily domain-containing protein [Monoraphidium minutum]|nr:MAG: major facilitator superfamily domain-containing protein [Monoraphidium minutum]
MAEDDVPQLPARTFSRVSRVLLPIVFLAGVANYLDRTNLTFAALQLNGDLGFTPKDYGLGAGFFYLGYGIAHLPSAFMTMRLGARWWYSSITIAWGIVASCAAAIRSTAGLCAQRFFLGIAEAGAIPSAIHLLAQFYPKDMLTKPFTAVTLANVLSVVFAAPLAAGLMSIEGGGLRGWQWLFVLEGIPSVILGIAMLAVVPNGPRTAWFLSPEEGELLHLRVHGSKEEAEAASRKPAWREMATLAWEAARMPMLWYFAIAGFLWVLCVFSLNSWIAIIIKNMLAGTALQNSTSTGGASSVNTLHATLLSAIPYCGAALAMWLAAWSSHRCQERCLHAGVPWLFGGLLLAFFAPLYQRSFGAGFAVIVIALTCAYSSQSVVFARVTESLDTKHAGVGVSIFNAVGAAIGGSIGPYAVGAFVQRTGTFVSAMIFMGMFLFAAGTMMTGLGIYELVHKRRGRAAAARRDAEAAPAAGGGEDLLVLAGGEGKAAAR